MAEYPYDTPIEDLLAVTVPPDPPGGDLDGVTPEELAAAEIAKHKEVLEPDAPVTARLSMIHMELAGIRAVLMEILEALDKKP